MNRSDTRTFFRAMFDTTLPYDERTAGTNNDAAQIASMGPLPLASITAPSLIIHGTLDGDVPFDDGLFAYDHIPGAQRYWMTNNDHLGFWLSPQALEAQGVARTFLRQHATHE